MSTLGKIFKTSVEYFAFSNFKNNYFNHLVKVVKLVL